MMYQHCGNPNITDITHESEKTMNVKLKDGKELKVKFKSNNEPNTKEDDEYDWIVRRC